MFRRRKGTGLTTRLTKERNPMPRFQWETYHVLAVDLNKVMLKLKVVSKVERKWVLECGFGLEKVVYWEKGVKYSW